MSVSVLLKSRYLLGMRVNKLLCLLYYVIYEKLPKDVIIKKRSNLPSCNKLVESNDVYL